MPEGIDDESRAHRPFAAGVVAIGDAGTAAATLLHPDDRASFFANLDAGTAGVPRRASRRTRRAALDRRTSFPATTSARETRRNERTTAPPSVPTRKLPPYFGVKPACSSSSSTPKIAQMALYRHRQQRLTDLVPRKTLLLQKKHATSASGDQGRDRRPAGSAADGLHQVELVRGIRRHKPSSSRRPARVSGCKTEVIAVHCTARVPRHGGPPRRSDARHSDGTLPGRRPSPGDETGGAETRVELPAHMPLSPSTSSILQTWYLLELLAFQDLTTKFSGQEDPNDLIDADAREPKPIDWEETVSDLLLRRESREARSHRSAHAPPR